MELNAILGAVGGAILGAIVWAMIAVFTGYEIGWIAWGVGAGVGYGAHLLEGRGRVMGVVCAGLAALSILGGKMMVVNHFVGEEIAGMADFQPTRENYDAIKAEAAAFAALGSEQEYPAFMVQYQYTDVATAGEVSQEEVNDFKEWNVGHLQAWAAEPPTFEAWSADFAANSAANSAAFADSIPMTELLFSSLGAMDILFFALGIITAFQVGSGGEYDS